MKSITITLFDGRTGKCSLPHPTCEYVECAGFKCECAPDEPLLVAGYGDPTATHDTYTSKALCARCKGKIGQLVVVVNTLFGIEEDARVLVHGRARVY